ncbi:hypothetical protein BDR22DRAFT_886467 [Usnea florida]
MSPGFQVAGVPSVTASFRGEKPVSSQSRGGTSGNFGPASVWPKGKQTSLSKPMNAGEYFSNKRIDLGPRARAHAMTPKPALPDNKLFENYSTEEFQPHFYYEQSLAGNPEQVSRAKQPEQQSILNSMASLSISPCTQAEQIPMGRCLDWERPGCTLSSSSKVSKYSVKFNHSYPDPSDYSISYERRANQTPMEQAGNCEYLPFPRSEFKVGTIVRMNVHEPDIKGASKPAILKASQSPTLVAGGPSGRRRKEHRHHGDFGPIYSENRICIVVNVAKSCYFAIPLFTHEGKGLAKIDPGEREDWISVEDHRKLGHCQQQSEHRPLRTAYMSPHANILDAVSTAWIPYGFPCRFDVPVAYQGKLDKASAERLVRLHRESWDAYVN